MTQNAIEGRVAIVTGSGRGLGRAMALGLAGAGVRVLVTDNDRAVVDEVTAEIRDRHGNVSAIAEVIDLADERAPAQLAARARSDLGGLHIVINNAGVGPEVVRRDFLTNPPKLWEVPSEAWHKTFAVNTHAPFHMACAVVPGFIQQGWGRIINVTTSLDTMLRAGYAPYGGSKAANEAHSAILAAELSGKGVTVNILVPGGPANTRLIPADAPLRREDLIQPDAMVPPLLWLVSDAASAVTGKRFLAALWDTTLSPEQALATSASPIGWPQVGGGAQMPKGWKDGATR